MICTNRCTKYDLSSFMSTMRPCYSCELAFHHVHSSYVTRYEKKTLRIKQQTSASWTLPSITSPKLVKASLSDWSSVPHERPITYMNKKKVKYLWRSKTLQVSCYNQYGYNGQLKRTANKKLWRHAADGIKHSWSWWICTNCISCGNAQPQQTTEFVVESHLCRQIHKSAHKTYSC